MTLLWFLYIMAMCAWLMNWFAFMNMRKQRNSLAMQLWESEQKNRELTDKLVSMGTYVQ